MHEQIAATLGRTALFGGLDQPDLLQLAGAGRRHTYRKGAYVFQQGAPGDALFVLMEGSVKVLYTSEDGDELVLATHHPPDVFGELALVDGGPRSASVQTLEPSTAFVLTRPAVLDLVRRQPALVDGLLASLGTLVRRLTAHAGDLVFLDLHGRVAKLLVRLVEAHGTERDDSVHLDLGMSQSDLAAMVGGSRQSVNQILHLLERRGILEVAGRIVVVRDVPALRRRAGTG